jgi:sporulation protein YlmC with PRC-barrel domain
MIRNLKHLKGFTIGASDGPIGKVKDAYFDDYEWAVRYLVVDTGSWLSGRSVLISPLFIRGVDWDAEAVDVTLSRERVKGSPDVDFDKPVSRQQEAEYYSHYQAFGYWAGPFVWGKLPYPGAAAEGAGDYEHLHKRMRRDDRKAEDSHLRSANEVEGYHIQALDGSIGHVEDFLLDDETWLIESLVVDTRNWLPGRHVMIPPEWVQEVDWLQRAAHVRVSREAIRQRPEYPGHLDFRGSRGVVSGSRQHAGNSRSHR